MINLEFDLIGLSIEAKKKKTNIIRVLFGDYIYKHVTRKDFVYNSGTHNNSLVQVSDHGLDNINVRIKSKVSEKIG